MKKVAYLVNQYPAISHTFIRREIHALECLGIKVSRFSLRKDSNELIDPRDKAELIKTSIVTQIGIVRILVNSIKLFLRSPIIFIRALKLAVTLGYRANASLRHVAYFLEACFIAKELISDGTEHLHAHFGTNSTTIALLCNKLTGIDYSFTVHGPEEFDKPISLSLGEKIQHAKFVVAISHYGRSQLCRWTSHLNWSKINVVRCGLDFNDYSEDTTFIESDNTTLICIGRLCEQKAQLLLIDAVAELIQEGIKLELILVGDGTMRDQVEEAITERNCGRNIRVTGWLSQDQITSEILKSRALILPSFAEGLPVVIMEALALGRPVISTYVAGIPELIVCDKNGWLVPASDTMKLKEAILKVLALEDTVAMQMSEFCIQSVKAQHDVNKEAHKLNTLIQASKTD